MYYVKLKFRLIINRLKISVLHIPTYYIILKKIKNKIRLINYPKYFKIKNYFKSQKKLLNNNKKTLYFL